MTKHNHCGRFGEKDRSSTYYSWEKMRERCRNQNHKDYHHYGGRGIKVCRRWDSFTAFLSDMGKRPPGTSIDRIDNSGDYTPENCRWATRSEQMRNSRRNRMLTYRGETLCIAEWTERLGFKKSTLRRRLDIGWSVEKSIETPLQMRGTK